MPHEFPKEKAASTSTRDPEIVNAPFRELATRLGSLNEHDLSSGVISGPTKIADGAVSRWGGVRTSVDPRLTTLSGGYYPKPLEADAVVIYDSPAWQEIETLTVTTGEDTLLLVAFASYAVGDAAERTTGQQTNEFPARMQFALEVDGSVVADTITGQADVSQMNAYEYQKWDNSKIGSDDWDFRHVERLPNATGLSSRFGHIRIVYSLDVVEGSHPIRLLARRAPSTEVTFPVNDIPRAEESRIYRNKTYPTALQNETEGWVFSRQLHAGILGGWQKATTTTASTFAPEDVEDGAILALPKISAQRIEALADVVNDLQEGDIARGAVRAEHVVTSPTVSDTVIDSDVGAVTHSYVGFEDASGDPLLTLAFGVTQATGGWILLLADVEVQDLQDSTGGYVDDVYGNFKLMATTGSGSYILDATEAPVSSDTLTPDDPGNVSSGLVVGTLGEVHHSGALVWAGDVASLPGDVTSFTLVGDVWDGNGGSTGTITATCKRANLTAIWFKR